MREDRGVTSAVALVVLVPVALLVLVGALSILWRHRLARDARQREHSASAADRARSRLAVPREPWHFIVLGLACWAFAALVLLAWHGGGH
jgi:hypothetical protein